MTSLPMVVQTEYRGGFRVRLTFALASTQMIGTTPNKPLGSSSPLGA